MSNKNEFLHFFSEKKKFTIKDFLKNLVKSLENQKSQLSEDEQDKLDVMIGGVKTLNEILSSKIKMATSAMTESGRKKLSDKFNAIAVKILPGISEATELEQFNIGKITQPGKVYQDFAILDDEGEDDESTVEISYTTNLAVASPLKQDLIRIYNPSEHQGVQKISTVQNTDSNAVATDATINYDLIQEEQNLELVITNPDSKPDDVTNDLKETFTKFINKYFYILPSNMRVQNQAEFLFYQTASKFIQLLAENIENFDLGLNFAERKIVKGLLKRLLNRDDLTLTNLIKTTTPILKEVAILSHEMTMEYQAKLTTDVGEVSVSHESQDDTDTIDYFNYDNLEKFSNDLNNKITSCLKLIDENKPFFGGTDARREMITLCNDKTEYLEYCQRLLITLQRIIRESENTRTSRQTHLLLKQYLFVVNAISKSYPPTNDRLENTPNNELLLAIKDNLQSALYNLSSECTKPVQSYEGEQYSTLGVSFLADASMRLIADDINHNRGILENMNRLIIGWQQSLSQRPLNIIAIIDAMGDQSALIRPIEEEIPKLVEGLHDRNLTTQYLKDYASMVAQLKVDATEYAKQLFKYEYGTLDEKDLNLIVEINNILKNNESLDEIKVRSHLQELYTVICELRQLQFSQQTTNTSKVINKSVNLLNKCVNLDSKIKKSCGDANTEIPRLLSGFINTEVERLEKEETQFCLEQFSSMNSESDFSIQNIFKGELESRLPMSLGMLNKLPASTTKSFSQKNRLNILQNIIDLMADKSSIFSTTSLFKAIEGGDSTENKLKILHGTILFLQQSLDSHLMTRGVKRMREMLARLEKTVPPQLKDDESSIELFKTFITQEAFYNEPEFRESVKKHAKKLKNTRFEKIMFNIYNTKPKDAAQTGETPPSSLHKLTKGQK